MCLSMASFGNSGHHSSCGGPLQERQLWNNHVSELTNAGGFLNTCCAHNLATVSALKRVMYFALRTMKYAPLVDSG